MKRLTFPHITSCTALLALANLGPAWAQSTSAGVAQQPEQTQTEGAQSGEYLRRVLLLQNGSFVRTACKLQDDAWVLGRKASSRTIPVHYVQSASIEGDLLKALRNQRDVGTPGTLPAWCLERGLLKEGLAQLDKNLSSHALRKQSLNILEDFVRFLPAPPVHQEGILPCDTFAEHAKWLATKNTASLHELSSRSLADMAKAQARTLAPNEIDAWDRCLTQVLKGSKARQRDLALSTLASWKGANSGDTLRRFAMLDSSKSTRNHSAHLLGTLDDPKQIFGLTGWLDHENQEIQARAASALGYSGYPAAVPALVAALGNGSSSVSRVPHAHVFIGSQSAYVQDFDVEVANRTSVADPIVNVLPTGVVLDAGVVSVTIHRTVYTKALSRITGHRAGSTEKSWTQWLEKYPTVDTDWRAPWPAPETKN
ncbi:MAG: hypothetical protein GY930_02560 [bacterium]|nr:hypothetical protein [bacterium]